MPKTPGSYIHQLVTSVGPANVVGRKRRGTVCRPNVDGAKTLGRNARHSAASRRPIPYPHIPFSSRSRRCTRTPSLTNTIFTSHREKNRPVHRYPPVKTSQVINTLPPKHLGSSMTPVRTSRAIYTPPPPPLNTGSGDNSLGLRRPTSVKIFARGKNSLFSGTKNSLG